MRTLENPVDEKNILIVEDEPNFAAALARTLMVSSDGKYQIETCESGEAACQRLERRRYHLVVCDCQLPGMDGPELLSCIKTKYTNTPTILMGDNKMEEVKARTDGIANGFLAKPFEMMDFLLLVQRVLDRGPKRSEFPSRGNQVRGENNTILIMDDDVSMCHLYSKVLTRARFDVHGATTVRAARELLQKNKYAVFVCDVHMGRERGDELVKEFRDTLSENGTQVVICSAYGQYRSYTGEIGADFFLEKPISLGTLLTLINRLMDDHHAPPAHHVRPPYQVKTIKDDSQRPLGNYSVKKAGQ
jgi:DNA-binding NtrC family response regulator